MLAAGAREGAPCARQLGSACDSQNQNDNEIGDARNLSSNIQTPLPIDRTQCMQTSFLEGQSDGHANTGAKQDDGDSGISSDANADEEETQEDEDLRACDNSGQVSGCHRRREQSTAGDDCACCNKRINSKRRKMSADGSVRVRPKTQSSGFSLVRPGRTGSGAKAKAETALTTIANRATMEDWQRRLQARGICEVPDRDMGLHEKKPVYRDGRALTPDGANHRWWHREVPRWHGILRAQGNHGISRAQANHAYKDEVPKELVTFCSGDTVMARSGLHWFMAEVVEVTEERVTVKFCVENILVPSLEEREYVVRDRRGALVRPLRIVNCVVHLSHLPPGLKASFQICGGSRQAPLGVFIHKIGA